MEKKEILFKEIDIIQSIITRMCSNSFLIKWWTITLIVWIIALDKINEKNRIMLLWLSFLTIFFFWRLDAYYLQQERLYRKLYKRIIENREPSNEYILDMNPERLFKKEDCLFCVMFSKTERPLYVLLIISLLIFWYTNFIF